jgi:hypothetical protein
MACYRVNFTFTFTLPIPLRILLWHNLLMDEASGFGGAEVVCWPLIPKFVGSNPAEAVGFLKGDKNP